MFEVGDEVVIGDTGGKQSYGKVLFRHGKIEHKRVYHIDSEAKEVDYYVRIDGFWNDRQEKGYWVCDEKMLQGFVRVGVPQNNLKAKVVFRDDIIKKENKMDILEIYMKRKIEKIKKQEERDIEKVKKHDLIFVEFCKFANNPKTQPCVNIDNYQFDESIVVEIMRLRDLYTDKRSEFYGFIDEVKAQLDMCETYDQKQAVLTQYKILKDGKINA